MCGIAGIIQSGSVGYNIVHLKKMTDAIAHRGPDGEGHWCNEDNTVLLGHRRLSIIDLSEAGSQPMFYQGRYTIIHNGEIYNYIELKGELLKKGYSFRSATDTEVIAAAYDCWKEDCLQYFDGMFAFALWDEKEKVLFAARDRFGEKPFFFFKDDTRFLFASEMKALWAAGIEKRPNLKMLFNFITIGYTDNPEQPGETFYENISKLPAASFIKFSPVYFNYTIKKYWGIGPEVENKRITDAEAIEQFSLLFSESVKRRLRSDVETGTSLSGGLDSSSVVAIISELKTENHKSETFTASFPGFEKDELTYARQVAEKFQLQQHIVNVNGVDLIADWEKLCEQQEEPFGSASIYAQYKVFELAKQHGVKVLLDGQGADETLAGYHKYYKWYWQELFRKGKLSGRKELVAARKLGITESFSWKNKIAAWFPSFASIVMEKHYLARAIVHPGLTKEFVQRQSHEAYYTPPDYFTLNGVLHFNTFTHGLEELLRFADRNSMAHGTEVRLPFLSHELVEFVFSLPAPFKIRNGWTKWLLRETMKNKLPGEIVWRRDKVGFEPPQKKWMELKPLQELIITSKEKLVSEKILKPEVLSEKINPQDAHEAENDDWRYLSSALLFK
jgi:asparagine synthase (glutamine-hydrolysing)